MLMQWKLFNMSLSLHSICWSFLFLDVVVCQCETLRSEKGVRSHKSGVIGFGYELLDVDAGIQT